MVLNNGNGGSEGFDDGSEPRSKKSNDVVTSIKTQVSTQPEPHHFHVCEHNLVPDAELGRKLIDPSEHLVVT